MVHGQIPLAALALDAGVHLGRGKYMHMQMHMCMCRFIPLYPYSRLERTAAEGRASSLSTHRASLVTNFARAR